MEPVEPIGAFVLGLGGTKRPDRTRLATKENEEREREQEEKAGNRERGVEVVSGWGDFAARRSECE